MSAAQRLSSGTSLFPSLFSLSLFLVFLCLCVCLCVLDVPGRTLRCDTVHTVPPSPASLTLSLLPSAACQLLAGLHFWVTPTTTELSQFSRVRRHKRQKKLPPLPEMDQVRLDAVSIMDKHKLRLLAGRHQRLLQWDTFLFVDKMDNLMFILVTVVLAFSWSETWSCVRNQAPHSATSYAVVIGAATALYFLFCIVWMLGFRHSEVRMSLYLGAGATVFAFTAVRYLCGPVLDFPLDAAFLDVSNRTAATLALLTNEQHAAQSSLTAFHVTLTLCAGVLSFLLFLPAMRYSRMYYDALPKAGMFKKWVCAAVLFVAGRVSHATRSHVAVSPLVLRLLTGFCCTRHFTARCL